MSEPDEDPLTTELLDEIEVLKARLAEAERKLSCGCHHSLDDSYGGCVLHITLRSHAELEEESERLQARLAEADRVIALQWKLPKPCGHDFDCICAGDAARAFLRAADEASGVQK